MNRSHVSAPPTLDRSALDGAWQLHKAVHNLLREVNEKIIEIESNKTLSRDAVIRQRADSAKAALARLSNLTQVQLREVEGGLTALREKRRSLLARGGQPHAVFSR